MNLSNLLNDDNDGGDKPNRRTSGPPSRPSLPSLTTRSNSFRSPSSASSAYPQLEGHHSSLFQSPVTQRASRPDILYQSPVQGRQPSPGSYSAHPLSTHAISPYGPGPAATGHAYGPIQRHPSHPSSSSTPSSAYGPTASLYYENPASRDAYQHNGSLNNVPPGYNQGPGTPLAPLNGPFRIPSHNNRDFPSTFSHLQSPGNVSHAPPGVLNRPSPQQTIRSLVHPSAVHQRPPSVERSGSMSSKQDREKSVSVSPKTVVSLLPRQGFDEPATPQASLQHRPSYPLSNGSYSSPVGDRALATLSRHLSNSEPNFLVDPLQNKHHQTTTPELLKHHSTLPLVIDTFQQHNRLDSIELNNPSNMSREGSENVASGNLQVEVTNAVPVKHEENAVQKPENTVPPSKKRAHDADITADETKVESNVKRRRVTEIPIWAQPCKKTKPLPKYQTKATPRTNGTALAAQPVRPANPPALVPVQVDEDSILGHWDPTFTTVIPHEEITRVMCDFLFQHVVCDETLETRSAGGPSSPLGLLEIEARLGTIVRKGEHTRFNIPIMCECVLGDGFDVAFESMMTAQQHHQFNERLNQVVKSSLEASQAAQAPPEPGKPTPKKRNPVQYVHTRERDTFYELPDSEISNLPLGLRNRMISVARKPRLRVTYDQKTGQVLARIVKIRVADLLVYSPRTPFDWRISVNAEVNWNGDLNRLIANERHSGGLAHSAIMPTTRSTASDRNKDRVSYKHQACQIDLTQVKPTVDVGTEGAVHELEVELDATLVRTQGLAAMAGQPNRYEDVVKGFVDNVRTLVRMLA